MFKYKWRYQFIFLFAFLAVILSFFGWKSWLVTLPQPLPQQSLIGASENKALLDGAYYEVSIPPTKQDKHLAADYRIWVPNQVSIIRGLLVKQHGCGDPAAATGLEHANDLQWQALALKHQLALLGTKLPTGNQLCDNWLIIKDGSESAFLKALTAFARESRHPELTQVPWVFWGHSGGADWSMQMLQKYPDRTIAVIALRSGGVLLPDGSKLLTSAIDSAILEVPVLFAVGEKEPYVEEALDLPQKVFSRYRKAGAFWALAVEANAGHETADTRLLAIPYLDAILTTRLTVQGFKLNPVDANRGWLSHMATHTVAPVSQYRGNPSEAGWFPNEETARKWQEYVDVGVGNRAKYVFCKSKRLFARLVIPNSIDNCSEGKVVPDQKPVEPTNVRAIRVSSEKIVLTWDFVPNLENGLPSFRVYRNNSLIKTLEGQRHNFGDAPEPSDIVLEFQDQEATGNSTYAVAAFNGLGESISQSSEINEGQ